MLRRVGADLCDRITARARACRHQRRLQREAQIRETVRQAVLVLHAQGLHPSTNRVGLLLARPGYLRAGFAAQVWHETVRELGLRPRHPS